VFSSADNVVSFSLDDVPVQHREAFIRDVCGRTQRRMEVSPNRDHTLKFDGTTVLLPDMMCTKGSVSLMAWERTAELMDDGNDDIMLSWNRGGSHVSMPGLGDFAARPAVPALLALDRRFSVSTEDSTWSMAIQFKRSLVTPFVRNLDDIRPDYIDGSNPVHRLLFSYLSSLSPDTAPPALTALISRHVTDLLVLALGARHDTASSGVRAARLAAIKQHLSTAFHEPGLNVDQVARKFAISTRYIRQLFAAENTSFSDYLTELRLAYVHSCLIDRRQVLRRIGDIAFEAGFVEPSTFYRQFRLRYGTAPNDVRHLAMTAGLPEK
jgi:AraC-like DNA-binding protein